jgi:glycosyltransferase involved in cell wall biosynthesis
MKLLVFSGLSDKKLTSKLEPLLSLKKVDKVYLIRNAPLLHQKIKSMRIPFFLNIPLVRELAKLSYGFFVSQTVKIDYIIGIYLRPHGIFANMVGKISGKPVIQLFVGNDVDIIEKHRLWFGNLLKKAQHIGVRGSRSKKRLMALMGENRFFIHHNLYTPPPYRTQLSEMPKEIDVLCVADFTKVKRIDIFLKVMKRLKKAHQDVKAVMLGANGGRSRYQKMKAKMNLEENVSFLGRVNNIESYYAKSKVFLLTSEAEGLPMALIEAMSMGLPCVVPDVGDISEICRDGYNAFLIRPLDEDAFASKIVKLLEDQSLYKSMSRNAWETIEKKKREFSLPYIKQVWDKIIV